MDDKNHHSPCLHLHCRPWGVNYQSVYRSVVCEGKPDVTQTCHHTTSGGGGGLLSGLFGGNKRTTTTETITTFRQRVQERSAFASTSALQLYCEDCKSIVDDCSLLHEAVLGDISDLQQQEGGDGTNNGNNSSIKLLAPAAAAAAANDNNESEEQKEDPQQQVVAVNALQLNPEDGNNNNNQKHTVHDVRAEMTALVTATENNNNRQPLVPLSPEQVRKRQAHTRDILFALATVPECDPGKHDFRPLTKTGEHWKEPGVEVVRFPFVLALAQDGRTLLDGEDSIDPEVLSDASVAKMKFCAALNECSICHCVQKPQLIQEARKQIEYQLKNVSTIFSSSVVPQRPGRNNDNNSISVEAEARSQLERFKTFLDEYEAKLSTSLLQMSSSTSSSAVVSAADEIDGSTTQQLRLCDLVRQRVVSTSCPSQRFEDTAHQAAPQNDHEEDEEEEEDEEDEEEQVFVVVAEFDIQTKALDQLIVRVTSSRSSSSKTGGGLIGCFHRRKSGYSVQSSLVKRDMQLRVEQGKILVLAPVEDDGFISAAGLTGGGDNDGEGSFINALAGLLQESMSLADVESNFQKQVASG